MNGYTMHECDLCPNAGGILETRPVITGYKAHLMLIIIPTYVCLSVSLSACLSVGGQCVWGLSVGGQCVWGLSVGGQSVCGLSVGGQCVCCISVGGQCVCGL